MKKAKFKISGMHCKTCSTLIEEELKDKAGIIMPKVNHESGKGVVMYDETKIDEKKIKELIDSVAHYTAEIEQPEMDKKKDEKLPALELKKNNSFYNSPYANGVFTGIGICSVFLNIILFLILFGK